MFSFEEIGCNDNNLVGKKCANLGEMTRMGLPVPYGFALSVDAYTKFLKETEAAQEIVEYFDKHGRRNRTLSEWTHVSAGLRRIVETPADAHQDGPVHCIRIPRTV